MELRQLEYFVAVADTGTFTAAAERTRTTQPNISAQIRVLERELGGSLFEKSGRGKRLTDAGRAALPHARAALAAAQRTGHAVDDVHGVARGSLAVGMVDGCSIPALFDALSRFRHRHPGVDLSLVEDESPDLAERVRSGDLDIALAGAPGRMPDGLESMVVLSEPVVAVVPHAHRFGGRKDLGANDLRGHTLIGLPRGAGIRTVFDRAYPDLTVAIEASSPDAVAALVRGGIGIGVLSSSIAAAHTSTLRALALRDAQEPALLGFLWRRQPSPAVTAFVDLCHETFEVIESATATT